MNESLWNSIKNRIFKINRVCKISALQLRSQEKQYQILLNPGTLIKNEGLRNIRASHIGHLVRFQVIKTTQFITSKLV